MEDIHVGHAVGKGGTITRIDIPMTSPLLDALRVMPDANGKRSRKWTAEEDAVLLEGRPRVSWGNIRRLVKCSEDTARERYRWLKEQGR